MTKILKIADLERIKKLTFLELLLNIYIKNFDAQHIITFYCIYNRFYVNSSIVYLFLSDSDSLPSLIILLSVISSLEDSFSLSNFRLELLSESSSFLVFVDFLSFFSRDFLSPLLLCLSSDVPRLVSSLRDDFFFPSRLCNLSCLLELRELDVEYPVSWRFFLE